MHVIKDRDESYKPREKLQQIRGRNEADVTYFFLAVRSEMHTIYTLSACRRRRQPPLQQETTL
jgi:hypothetical protein